MLLYVLMLVVFGVIIYQVLQKGRLQENRVNTISAATQKIQPGNSFELFSESFKSNLTHPLPILLLQIIVIVAIVRLFGFLFSKIHQPTVVGEIVAGIVLGPSVLGAFFPELFNFIFPSSSVVVNEGSSG